MLIPLEVTTSPVPNLAGSLSLCRLPNSLLCVLEQGLLGRPCSLTSYRERSTLGAAAAPGELVGTIPRATRSEREHRVAAELPLSWLGFAAQWCWERWLSPRSRDRLTETQKASKVAAVLERLWQLWGDTYLISVRFCSLHGLYVYL